jgi:zinc transport system permease protein
MPLKVLSKNGSVNISMKSLLTDLPQICSDFKETYDFFPEIFHSGWLIAILLSITGVLIVARNQIFIGAAIAQTSTFGIAIALYVLGLEAMSDVTGQARQDLILNYSIAAATLCTCWAFVNKSAFFKVLARLKLPIHRSNEAKNSHKEDTTAWLFLISSAGTIVLLSKSPVGKEVIDKLIFSSIIGAEKSDVSLILTILTTSIVLLIFNIDKLTLVFTDRDYAVTIKVPATLIEIIYAVFAGVILGSCLKISGTLYTFGCLILPVLIGANMVKSTRVLFIISPLIAFTAAFIGFALGNFYNIPQTQLTVFLLSLAYPFSRLLQQLRSSG